MNARSDLQTSVGPGPTRSQKLLKDSVGKLHLFVKDLQPLRKALNTVVEFGDEKVTKLAKRNLTQLNRLEPSVTMIGQIKSGKTSLVNSMIGWPDLLPADVNPWTSVVTSLHMAPHTQSPERSAIFSFFESDEWDRLVRGGGRVGELAKRAGAEDEMAKITAQIEQMREKSKKRLGRRFEMLLGQHHDYGYFDQELIERYVCLGDDFEEDENSQQAQGRFADITRSADLHFQQPAFPMRLCIRDTPGVNDTFMMREQITIRAIRDSRICVVVLSAHQALSSTDLALIRLISNVKSREVIIFVNRIDELSDPRDQVPQIKASILETLSAHDGPKDAAIVFGCALWAQNAMTRKLSALPAASKEALLNWAEITDAIPRGETDPCVLLWHLSGLPALFDAISDRIVEGVGRETVAQLVASTRNLLNSLQMSEDLSAKVEFGTEVVQLSQEDISDRLQTIQTLSVKQLKEDLDTLQDSFSARIDRVHKSFLQRATEALITHLERYGEDGVWEYNPSGLRMLLSSSYKVFGKKCQAALADNAQGAIEGLQDLYQEAFQTSLIGLEIAPPPPPRIPPPVTLGQTIALDIKGSWWKNWWIRRRGYQAFASGFYDLVAAETEDFIADLERDTVAGIREVVLTQFSSFMAEQSVILHAAANPSATALEKVDEILGPHAPAERVAALKDAYENLDQYLEK